MPALLPAPGVAVVKFFHETFGRGWATGFALADGFAEEFTPTDIADLGIALADAWAGDMAPLLSHDTTFTGNETLDLSSDTAPVYSITSSTVGGVDSPGLPLNVAAVLKLPIARRYRGGHGHLFLAGVGQSDQVDSDTWLSAAQTAWADALTSVIAAAHGLTTSHGGHWVGGVLSRRTGGAERDAPVFAPVVDGTITTQPRICSRRRRLPKIS